MKSQHDAFDELTVAEVIDQLVRRPVATLSGLIDYFASAPQQPRQPVEISLPGALSPDTPAQRGTPIAHPATDAAFPQAKASARPQGRDWALFLAHLVGLTLAWAGTGIMAFAAIRTEESALWTGMPLALIGAAIWLGAQFVEQRAFAVQPLPAPSDDFVLTNGSIARILSERMGLRLMIIALAVMASLVTFVYSAGNTFRLVGVIAWGLSIVFAVQSLAPGGWSPLAPLRRWRAKLLNTDKTASPLWVTIALVVIILFGAAFRLTDIDGTPPEMTSDHVEKLLDSQRVLDGGYNIYFQNNGGREPLQMYVMAAFVGLTGLPMNYDTLKLVTALEGIITLPIFFWLGRELVGRYDRRLGWIVGLALAALVAASYWHLSLSRLGLRIIYTPGIVALIFIYLTRALRENRRIDFINAGLALGAGLYMYQVIRIMPVVIVVGVGIAVIFAARNWAERRQYLLNLCALVLVAFVVFMPLFRFSIDYPDDFWRRTSGRLFGDDLTQTVDEDGNLVERVPTLDERFAAFGKNLPVLTNNIRNALLMYTWKGDVAWISAAPNYPALDPLAGALLLVGLGGWIGWIIRKRDAALWLVLPAWFILIFPSALSIAYPIENPSATRMSGTLPFAYLIAAFGLALLLSAVMRIAPRRLGAGISALAFIAVIGISYGANAQTFFVDFRRTYVISSKPYSSAGVSLREFATHEGSYGNAFMIAYPYWWDHRALGIEGGRINWDNGIVSRDDVPEFLQSARQRTNAYQLDVERPLLFLYSPDDADTELRLRLWFPNGRIETFITPNPNEPYNTYTVPPLGEAGFENFLAAYAAE